MKRQVFLVGYRATGKTTIGKMLSRAIGWKFVDIDEEIEKNSSKSIRKIFEEDGEERFRDIESEILARFSNMEDTVFSTGGGIVIREKNREILKKGFVVLLDVCEETIIERLRNDTTRPPLTNLSLEEEVKKTLEERKKLYEEIYHAKVTNEKASPETITELIKNLLPFA